jgi:uncharacterized protein (TIGR02246 family)
VSVHEHIERYVAAVHAKDADAFAELYAEDARNFDMWGRFSYEGRDAVRAMAQEWFASVGTDEIRVEFQEVREVPGDDVAVMNAFIRFSGISAEGEELRSMTNRVTWGLRRTPDGWKIAHEHTSAPLGDDLKGILQRS